MEGKMKITAALLTASLLLGSAGAAFASEVDPLENMNAAASALNNLPFGSQARNEADNLLTQAQEAYNHHNQYDAYILVQRAQQVERQATM
jgi:hypothetical protein